mgnify:CR=1 FL=1
MCIHIQIMRKFEYISKFSVYVPYIQRILVFFWKNETFHLIFDHSFRTSCLWYWFYVIILSECDIAFLCCSLISSLSSSASATLPILLCWRQMSKSFRMPLTQNTFDEKEKKAKDLKITKKAGHQILCSPKLSKHSLFLWDSVIKKFVKTRCNFELLEDGTVSFQSKSFKSFVQFFFFSQWLTLIFLWVVKSASNILFYSWLSIYIPEQLSKSLSKPSKGFFVVNFANVKLQSTQRLFCLKDNLSMTQWWGNSPKSLFLPKKKCVLDFWRNESNCKETEGLCFGQKRCGDDSSRVVEQEKQQRRGWWRH